MSDKSIPLPVLLECLTALHDVRMYGLSQPLTAALWNRVLDAQIALQIEINLMGLSVPVAEEVTE